MIIEQRDAPQPAEDAMPTPAPARTGGRWRWRLVLALAIALYFSLWALTAFDKVNPTDLDVFFLPAVRIALAGHPLQVYTLRVGLIYPNANGPLSLIPLTLAAWIAEARGWLNDVMLRRALVFVISAIFPLLVGWEAVRAVERFGPPLRGFTRAIVYLPIILTPLLWLDALYYGHIEQTMVVWLALAATRLMADGRYLRSGALLGLALLARSDASLIVLALLLTLLVYRRWRGALLTATATVGALTLGLAPFLLADGRDVIFSLFTFRGALPVGGGDLWSLSNADIFLAVAQHLDAIVTLMVAILLILIAHLVRSDLDLNIPDIYGLLTVASFCFALLIKTLWPYYFLESALFATVWALAAMPRAGALQSKATFGRWLAWASLWLAPLGVTACAVISEYGLEANNYDGWIEPWISANILCGIGTLTICMAALLGGRWVWSTTGKDVAPATGGILAESALDPAIEG